MGLGVEGLGCDGGEIVDQTSEGYLAAEGMKFVGGRQPCNTRAHLQGCVVSFIITGFISWGPITTYQF